MTKEKVKGMLDRIPSYVQSLIAIGGLVFGMGILYGDVQEIKKELAKSELSMTRQSEMATQINTMQQQLTSAEKNQERTNATLESLSTTIRTLSVSVARVEGKLDAEKDYNRREK